MMTDADKQLVALAAKAAGVCLHPEVTHSYGNWGCDTTCTICKKEPSAAMWRPLTDDGDALRLAVVLILDIRHVCDEVSVRGLFGEWYTEPVFEDRLECTRRVIVRAAASIGKLMP
jgi:hypothetical protein